MFQSTSLLKHVQFPFGKVLIAWMATEVFQRRRANRQKKTLCFTQLFVKKFLFFFPTRWYFNFMPLLSSVSQVCHIFVFHIGNMSASGTLKKDVFFFSKCIILPFNLNSVNRMDYNVDCAKSVLFLKVLSVRKYKKKVLIKRTEMLYTIFQGYFVFVCQPDISSADIQRMSHGPCTTYPLWHPVQFTCMFFFLSSEMFSPCLFLFEDTVCNPHHECH